MPSAYVRIRILDVKNQQQLTFVVFVVDLWLICNIQADQFSLH